MTIDGIIVIRLFLNFNVRAANWIKTIILCILHKVLNFVWYRIILLKFTDFFIKNQSILKVRSDIKIHIFTDIIFNGSGFIWLMINSLFILLLVGNDTTFYFSNGENLIYYQLWNGSQHLSCLDTWDCDNYKRPRRLYHWPPSCSWRWFLRRGKYVFLQR